MRKRKPQASHEIAHPKKRAALEAYGKLGSITAACEAAGVHRRTHYDWLEADEAYAEAFTQARGVAADSLEAEAISRARDGWREPVYQGGKMVGTILKKSDTLLIFLLKGLRPEKFRDRHEVSGPEGQPVVYQVISKVPQSPFRAALGSTPSAVTANATPQRNGGHARDVVQVITGVPDSYWDLHGAASGESQLVSRPLAAERNVTPVNRLRSPMEYPVPHRGSSAGIGSRSESR